MDEEGAVADAIASKVYRDEPIPGAAGVPRLPGKYLQMQRIAFRDDPYEQSAAAIFFRQGQFMADFEDDFDYRGEFFCYFPTYRAMDDRQLRGYFSWRTRVRRGMIEPTSLSFAFVYLYELLNRIGVDSPEEGFLKLRKFRTAYRLIDAGIERYASLWMRDYVVYHNLDRRWFEELTDDDSDRAVLVLADYKSHSAAEVFAALDFLSPYKLEHSAFFRYHSDDVRTVVAGVFAALAEYCAKNLRNSVCERLIGKMRSARYNMFRSAVFYDPQKHPDSLYEVNPLLRFSCRNGIWSCERFLRHKERLRLTGAILKNIDHRMRLRYGFKSVLKPEKIPAVYAGIIGREIERLLELKRKNARSKIAIDLSKLQEIRHAALETQRKLIVEEPEEDSVMQQGNPIPAPSSADVPVSSPSVPDAPVLSGEERRLLESLLYGKDPAAGIGGQLLSVLVDSINGKFFDRFGDTVITWDGEMPELLEDYRDELKGIIAE